MRIGYACLNFHVKEAGFSKKTLQLAAFKKDQERGYPRTQDIIFDNIRYIDEVTTWNQKHGSHIFRFSHFAPFMTEFKFDQLPDYRRIKAVCKRVGALMLANGHRLTNHPGQFAVLCSPKDDVNQNTINELNKVSQIFDLFELPVTPFSKINIHIGGTYGNKEDTLKRFCDNVLRLSPGARSRLTIENDDRPNGYPTEELVEGVSQKVQVPVVFDIFHHQLNPGKLTAEAAMKLAASTWPKDIPPVVHHSDSRALHEEPGADPVAHSEWLYSEAQTYGLDVDLILEAKGCDHALLRYQQKWPRPTNVESNA